MARLGFDFEAAKIVAQQAGFSGMWHQEMNGRWRLPIEEGAGLEWSPTRSKLSAYGPSEAQERLEAAVEKALKGNLMSAPGAQGTGEADLEVIDTYQPLLGWLIQLMRAGPEGEYPKPLVTCAKKVVRQCSYFGGRESITMFSMWISPPYVGHSFKQMTPACPTRPYSITLMDWAGQMLDRLTIGDLYVDDALNDAIECLDLTDQFREKNKGGKSYLMSRRTFEEQYGLRVRIEQIDC